MGYWEEKNGFNITPIAGQLNTAIIGIWICPRHLYSEKQYNTTHAVIDNGQ